MTELQHLPQLTPDQANVVVAMLGVEGRIIDAATFAAIPLANFLDHLQSPEVRAHLDAAERAARQRARTRLADAAHDAVEVLEAIAKDDNHDKTERRRAATTIIRALTPRLASRAAPNPARRDPTCPPPREGDDTQSRRRGSSNVPVHPSAQSRPPERTRAVTHNDDADLHQLLQTAHDLADQPEDAPATPQQPAESNDTSSDLVASQDDAPTSTPPVQTRTPKERAPPQHAA